MPKVQLEKAYAPSAVENRIYETWESNGYFVAPIRPGRKPFVIMIPPPNVTGRLTIGHVLNNTLQDILVRWHRMRGEDTLWLPGTDHAGIATQIKVEAELAKEGLTRHDVGREELLRRIWEWRELHGGIILQQLRKLGASCDWSRERFTLDENLSRAVATIFVRLYNKGLIYRGKRIVNWDPVSQTALSDEQVEYRNVHSHLWHIRYPLTDGSGHLVVATTRPETMLGDTAVAVHPDDSRFRHLHGMTVSLPLTDRKIPIVPDEYVDQEFGTGCVKVTPAHDPNDFEIARRHTLEFITVIGPAGRMTDQVPEQYRGLTREECRKLVVKHLEEQGLLEKVEPHTHSVGHNERTGTVIEPLLSEQWFVSMKELAKPAIDAVREGKIAFIPKHWEKTYFHWMENVRDWCISRQIWWGHRIPLWTVKETGEVIASADDPTKDPKYRGLTLVQDPDVLDTWFSSWLWPFSTLGWPDETEDLKHFFPTSVLVTAPDIIFLWVARMIMASEEVFNLEPFHTVYYTGVVRDMRGRKLSKSLGNSPDPLDVIDQYGADALRFTIISLTPHGGDIRFGVELCEMGRNFANKLWNATRFLLMNLPEEGEDFPFLPVDCATNLSQNLEDRWITSAFFSTVNEVTRELEKFRFADATKTLYAFVWNDFCDWYLELIKTRLQNGSAEEKRAALAHALGVLHGTLRLLHPFIPFVTEEIYQTLRTLSGDHWPEEVQAETIMYAPFPIAHPEDIDVAVEEEFSLLQETVNALRNIRGELQVPKSTMMRTGVRGASGEQKQFLTEFAPFIQKLAGLDGLIFDQPKPKGSASAVVKGIEVYVPLEGLINLDAEQARLSKERERLSRLVQGAQGKLANPQFVENANREVVETERQKLKDLEASLEKVNRYMDEVKAVEGIMKYLILALLLVSSLAQAATSLTVYNQNLALVRETRQMEFKKGTGEVMFRDVAAQIDATSVHFSAPGVDMLEQNFDYDLVSPDKLLQKYVDREIEVVMKESSIKGKLLTSSWGTQGSQIVLQQPDGSVRSILQESIQEIRYPDLPGGLITRPTLRWLVDADNGGTKETEVSYLTGGMSWRADYVLVLNSANTKSGIDAWVTIENTSGATYQDAKLKLIAGEVHRAPTPRPMYAMDGLETRAVSVKAAGFEEQSFFEYHLYTLQRPATVANNQTKQLSLFPSTSANLRKIYEYDYQKKQDRVGVSVEFENREENGLGMALPAGRVRVYQEGPDQSQEFLGEDNVEHTPKNEKVRVQIGNAFDIVAERQQMDFRQISNRVTETDIQVKLRNHKKEAVDIMVVDYFYGDWDITKHSHDFKKVTARKVEFTVHAEPEQEAVVTYTVRVKIVISSVDANPPIAPERSLVRLDSYLQTPVTYVKGVGPARAKALEEIDIRTVEDLLEYYPRRYLDRTRIMKIKDLRETEHEVTIVGTITYVQPRRGRRGKSWLVAGVDDGTGVLQCVWFQGTHYWQKSLPEGEMVAVSGRIEDKGIWQIVHPAVDRLGESGDRELYNTGRIISLYHGNMFLRKVGLESANVRRIMRTAITTAQSEIDEYLPLNDLAQVGALPRAEAIEQIHFPESQPQLFGAWNRVRYEELFFYQLLFALRRYHNRMTPGGAAFERVGPITKKVLAALPFELTEGQKQILHEVRADLQSPVPMQRLLQGEVGSGKTTVALVAMAMAADSGFQSVMMAPTELLAEQHAHTILPIADAAGLHVRMMRGKQKVAERREILAAIASGQVEITVGTHALLNENLSFPNLGLVIIDEQHRFGVEQRSALRSKGIRPNLLLMTATPIPRTMRLANVGDLDVSSLHELPSGPRRVITAARTKPDRPKVYNFLIERAQLGERVFIICPLIEESEKTDTEAAMEYHGRVSAGVLRSVKVGLLHGRQKPEEKQAALEKFRTGETPVIVATPVIEVGVDVPEATVMLVENPERFGLAQLHQLRGRIGRLGQKAWMILLPGSKLTPEAEQRIKVIQETTDGFVIAEKDLELRGSGQFFGTRQSGEFELRYSHPVRDEPLLLVAREKALAMIEEDPTLAHHPKLRARFEKEHAHKLGFLAGG